MFKFMSLDIIIIDYLDCFQLMQGANGPEIISMSQPAWIG